MKRVLGLLILAAAAAVPAVGQEVDLTGAAWRVFRMETLSIYTLQEHQTASANQVPSSNQITFGGDGAVTTDLTGLGFQTWALDQGFLVMTTTDGNLFYRPRQLSDSAVLLVQTDVLARNGLLVSITSKPSGNLLLVR